MKEIIIKADVLLMTTFQTSATTLVFWLTVCAEQMASFIWCVSCKLFTKIATVLHFAREKGTNNCLVVVWCKTETNCRSCEIVTTNGF